MIAPQDGNPILVSHLQCNQQSDSLHTVMAPIHIVAHEQIIRVRHMPPNLKQLHQIMELAVDVSAYYNWCANRHHICFFDQYFLGLIAQDLDLEFRQGFTFEHVCNLSVQVGEVEC